MILERLSVGRDPNILSIQIRSAPHYSEAVKASKVVDLLMRVDSGHCPCRRAAMREDPNLFLPRVLQATTNRGSVINSTCTTFLSGNKY